MTVDTNKLPLGNSDFIDLRSQGKVYVDKTRMIYELAKSDAPIFLSRPRRFGKSLLVSTFASLFSKGLEDFKGLEIEKLWKEEKTYPVMRFDFSEINKTNAQIFLTDFARTIKEVTEDFGMKTKAEKFGSVFSAFRSWLRKEPSGKYVLLIDEYDSPLTEFLSDPEQFSLILSNLSQFYATIKACSGKFRFIFCTGIARFQKASIFSPMNNFTDITLKTEYGTLVGYTQDELEKYFDPYLSNAAKVLKTSKVGLLKQMQDQYDGFCFDRGGKNRLYSPWSVLSFLKTPADGLCNYWTDSGGAPTILDEYFKGHEFLKPEEFGVKQQTTIEDLASAYKYEQIQTIPLLTQTGYYTIDSVENDKVVLRYPNREVFNAMAVMYARNIYNGNNAKVAEVKDIGIAAKTGNPEEVVNVINRVLLNIPRSTHNVFTDEATVLTYFCILLACSNWNFQAEKYSGTGRADVVAYFDEYTYVFELKFLRDKDHKPAQSAEKLMEDAIRQVKNNMYGKELRTKYLVRLAMIFSEDKRYFIKWQQVD